MSPLVLGQIFISRCMYSAIECAILCAPKRNRRPAREWRKTNRNYGVFSIENMKTEWRIMNRKISSNTVAARTFGDYGAVGVMASICELGASFLKYF
jgi:hypothetical protein